MSWKKIETLLPSVVLALVGLMALPVQGQIISLIGTDGSWYKVYDGDGKQVKMLNVSEVGELTGYSESLIVFRKKGFYYIFDSNFKRQGLLSVATAGEIVKVSTSTIVSRKGQFTLTFYPSGTLLRTNS